MKRRLSRDEALLWGRVAQTVTPLDPSRPGEPRNPETGAAGPAPEVKRPKGPAHPAMPRQPAAPGSPVRSETKRHAIRPLDRHGLDASWDKKLARGMIAPDFTLDLHGHSLDAAHLRLDHGLGQAKALGARLVLVITGRPRPVDAADRAHRRGAIRAKLLDWLAHGDHAQDIAAVRGAHRRHGGAGAVYVVLRRRP